MILAQAPAAVPPGDGDPSRWQFRWSLLDGLDGGLADDPSLLALLACGLSAMVAVSLWLYWRERHALPRPVLVGAAALRLMAIAGIVVALLGPEWRKAEQVIRPSRVVVLVDDSVSMAMPSDAQPSGASQSRTAQAGRLLLEQSLLARLTQTHLVSVAPTSAATKTKDFVSEASSAPMSAPSAGTDDESPGATFDLETVRPTAQETRLGDALQQTLEAFSGQPLAGIVLLSDGRQNAGRLPSEIATVAARQGTPVLTIGFGPERAGDNLAVRDLVAPSNAYPADEIELTAVVETTGASPATSVLSLYRRSENDPPEAAVLLHSQSLPTPPDEALAQQGDGRQPSQTITFKTKPEEVGRYVYSVRATPLPKESRTDDNVREATVEVVDRITRVLLWAGGPSRDYRFLRNQLQRDDSFVVDVRLQSAPAAAVQDARQVLEAFPETARALDEYDVVAAFDPDWSELDERGIELLSEWVSQRGGGLFYAPGVVNTPKWRQRDPSSEILKLLPVELPDRLALLTPLGSSSAASKPRPVRLTRAGGDAGFLWIAGSPEASREAWRAFDGFYRVGQIAAIRPGATVYAEAPTENNAGDAASVLFAEQFFGAGRVFYCGTTELWRLRKGNPSPFSTITTALLRRLAQGRLLSNSPGGSLQFERERYNLGDTMVLRVMRPSGAGDQADQPGGETDPARVQILSPSGETQTVQLEPGTSRREAGIARLPAEAEGVYEAVLNGAPGASQSAQARVVAPAAERVHPTRDARLLAEIARAGGGHYYPTAEAALAGAGEAPPVADALPSREETRIVYGSPDPDRGRRLGNLLLGVICGALIVEWLTRRLARLA